MLLAVGALLALPYLTEVTEAARACAHSTEPNATGDNVATGVTLVIIGSAVISAIFAAGMVMCGALNLRGTDIGWILSLDPQSGSSAASVCCAVASAPRSAA